MSAHTKLDKRICLILSALFLIAISQSTIASDTDKLDCDDAYTTRDMEYCASQKSIAADKRMRHYLIASYTQYNHDPDTVKAIKLSQQAWEVYENSNCQAVYNSWNTGSIRGLMAINCHTRMTKQRTHELWLNYLTYMDSTPPVLPEPIRD